MKIYIAGPMSGLVEFNRPAFMFTAAKLTGRGNTVLNPAILPDGLSQAEYMDICLAMLRCAEVIYLLKGWLLFRTIKLTEVTVVQRQRPHKLLYTLVQTADDLHAGVHRLRPERSPLMTYQGLQDG